MIEGKLPAMLISSPVTDSLKYKLRFKMWEMSNNALVQSTLKSS